MITQCCVCRKIKNMRGAWVRMEPYPGLGITHGYCPECKDAVMREIKTKPENADVMTPVRGVFFGEYGRMDYDNGR